MLVKKALASPILCFKLKLFFCKIFCCTFHVASSVILKDLITPQFRYIVTVSIALIIK